jgi:hypothetical protein
MRIVIIAALAAMSLNAQAFRVSDNPKWFIDFNVASFHNQEFFYTEETKTGVNRPFMLDSNGGFYYGYEEYTYTETVATPFNEDNFGIGVRYQAYENLDLSVGFYDNSFYKTSVYAGIEVHTKRDRWISVGAALALVSGYSGTPTESVMIFLPIVQIGPPQIGARIGYMPVGETKFGTLQFYLGF